MWSDGTSKKQQPWPQSSVASDGTSASMAATTSSISTKVQKTRDEVGREEDKRQAWLLSTKHREMSLLTLETL
jgi:hypothetical protein